MAVIKIKLFVPEIANVLTLFNKIQVQRSEAGTPYTDAKFITADTAAKPELQGTTEGPFTIQGQSLKLKVDGGAEQNITFVSANPAVISRIVDEINTDLTGVTASSVGGKLKLQGDLAGTFGILELTGGTALTTLGFTTGQKDNGEDAHISLQSGVDSYEYDDGSGAASYWYRTRFYHTTSGVYSSWSDWMQGSTGGAITASLLTVGKIKLANIDGTAMVNCRVTIVNVFNPLSAGGYFLAGASKSFLTDGMGQGEITLVKGSMVDVILEGTSVTRRIVVPSSGTEFDLMDATLVQDDPFNIQVPDLPAAARRSL